MGAGPHLPFATSGRVKTEPNENLQGMQERKKKWVWRDSFLEWDKNDKLVGGRVKSGVQGEKNGNESTKR